MIFKLSGALYGILRHARRRAGGIARTPSQRSAPRSRDLAENLLQFLFYAITILIYDVILLQGAAGPDRVRVCAEAGLRKRDGARDGRGRIRSDA